MPTDAKPTVIATAEPSTVKHGERRRSPAIYLYAIAIYLSSRLIIAMAIVFAKHFVAPNCMNGVCASQSPWTQYLLRWDGGWYKAIATNGYSYDGNPLKWSSVAFYPLYPYLSRIVAAISGLSIDIALLIVSNLAALAAVLLLVRLISDRMGNAATLLTVALLSYFPTSFFFSAGYTESLALLLSVGFFLQLKGGNLFAATAFAALATATRATGIVLVAVLLWELWKRHRPHLGQVAMQSALAIIVGGSGLWLYMLYLGLEFGNPFAFSEAQAAWNGNSLTERLWAALTLKPIRSISLNFSMLHSMNPWYFLAFSVLTIACWRRLSTSLAIFATGTLLVPYLTLTGGPARFTSMHRFVLLIFPAFIVLADLCERRAWLSAVLIGLSAAALFMYTVLFAQSYWIV